jgi:hypothetical protein
MISSEHLGGAMSGTWVLACSDVDVPLEKHFAAVDIFG